MTGVKTAMGKNLDMGALVKRHEEMKAVSNVGMNARGDRLDAQGEVKFTVQETAQEQLSQPSRETTAKMSDAVKPTKAVRRKTTAIKEVKRTPIKDSKGKVVKEEIEYSDGSMEVVDVLDSDLGE